jgi:hypothetical protein
MILPEQMADLLAQSIVTIGLSRATVSLLLTEDRFDKSVLTASDLAALTGEDLLERRSYGTARLAEVCAASAGWGCISAAKSLLAATP